MPNCRFVVESCFAGLTLGGSKHENLFSGVTAKPNHSKSNKSNFFLHCGGMDSHSPTSLRMFIPSSAPSPQSYGHFTFECSIAEHGRGRNKPVPRSGHRIVADDANLYSFGGYNPYSNSTDYGLFPEIWKYNFATRKWTMLSNSGPPEAASHSMILVGDFVLVWGGTGYPWGHCLSNTLHAFSLVQRKWNVLPCTGDVPSHRYGQSMTFKDGHLYVIGECALLRILRQ